jgi:hypothetical protein
MSGDGTQGSNLSSTMYGKWLHSFSLSTFTLSRYIPLLPFFILNDTHSTPPVFEYYEMREPMKNERKAFILFV